MIGGQDYDNKKDIWDTGDALLLLWSNAKTAQRVDELVGREQSDTLGSAADNGIREVVQMKKEWNKGKPSFTKEPNRGTM